MTVNANKKLAHPPCPK